MTTVAEIQAQLETTINTLNEQAATFLDKFVSVTNVEFSDGFNIDSILPPNYDYATVPEIHMTPSGASTPALDFSTNPAPTPPDTTFSTLVDTTVPDNSAVAPVITFPVSPDTTLPDAPTTPDPFESPTIPDTPTLHFPTVPTLTTISLPGPPGVSIPAFISLLPTDDLVCPTHQFEFAEQAYQSALLDPLRSKLLSDLTYGGYGIDATDEAALLERARDREVEVAMTRIEEAGRAMAVRGFPLPPGELAIHIDRAWQDMQDKVSGVSREILLDRAKRFVDNRQFTIEQVRQTEQILIGFHSAVQERALNAAKALVEFAVAIFNTQVAKFVAKLDSYKAEAAAFGERVRANLVVAEIYRTQIEAAKIGVDVQRNQVEIYNAQLKGIQTQVDVFRVQMEAARVQSEIERIRLEAFKEQVDAYTAQVRAKVAEFEMFRAQIDGETAKVKVYDSQVQAFTSQVNAMKVQADIRLGRLQSETEQARTKLVGFQGQLDAYKADIERLLKTGALRVDLYKADIDQYRTVNDFTRDTARLQQEVLRSTIDQNIAISRTVIANAEAKLRATVAALDFKSGAEKFGAEKFYGMLTSAQQSLQAIAVQTATG